MSIHYSQPKGFVGRSIIYTIYYNGQRYGVIVGGSSTLNLPGRKQIIKNTNLNNVVNNTFFHVHKINNKYPVRNFTNEVLKEFQKKIQKDWKLKYGDQVIFIQTLVQLPRTGQIYKRNGYTNIGVTKGFTCKRVSQKIQKSTDSWSGARVWDKTNLRPKLVFIKSINN